MMTIHPNEAWNLAGGQRQLLYLGEINSSQKAAWTKVTEVFGPIGEQTQALALYPTDGAVPEHVAHFGLQVGLTEFTLRRPGSELFCAPILPASVVLRFLPGFRSLGFTRLHQWIVGFRLVTPGRKIGEGSEGGGEGLVFHNDAVRHGLVPACPY